MKKGRTVRIKVFKFNELSEQAQKKALEKYYGVNTDFDWWDFVYDKFKAICTLIGVDVDLEKTYFSGFSHQGQGATFTAEIDFAKLIDGINGKAYLAHSPNLHTEVPSFSPDPCEVDKRVIRLIKKGNIDIYTDVRADDQPYSSKVEFRSNYTYNECVNYKNIDGQLDQLESWLTDIVSELDNLLFRLLESEYEYRTSEEAIKAAIIANEYEFTQEGKFFPY
jgi:hypothetical protein